MKAFRCERCYQFETGNGTIAPKKDLPVGYMCNFEDRFNVILTAEIRCHDAELCDKCIEHLVRVTVKRVYEEATKGQEGKL